jgi:pilus assembly protein FimV
VESFKEGLRTEFSVGEVLKALLFELAAAREAMGQPGKALFHLQKISKMDPKYRDVPNLMNQLAKTASPEDDPVPPGGGGKKMSNGTNGVHGPSKPNGTPSGGSGAAGSANKPTDPPSGKNRKVGYL